MGLRELNSAAAAVDVEADDDDMLDARFEGAHQHFRTIGFERVLLNMSMGINQLH